VRQQLSPVAQCRAAMPLPVNTEPTTGYGAPSAPVFGQGARRPFGHRSQVTPPAKPVSCGPFLAFLVLIGSLALTVTNGRLPLFSKESLAQALIDMIPQPKQLEAPQPTTSTANTTLVSAAVHARLVELELTNSELQTTVRQLSAQLEESQAVTSRMVEQAIQDQMAKASQGAQNVSPEMASQLAALQRRIAVLESRPAVTNVVTASGGRAPGADVAARMARLETSVNHIVADTTGQLDWALTSLGGSIDFSKTTAGMTSRGGGWGGMLGAVHHADGLPPQVVLDQDLTPGRCFAFPVVGNITVNLRNPTVVSSVAVDHIEKKLRQRRSEPQHFEVVAWDASGTQHTISEPGCCSYHGDGVKVQVFPTHAPRPMTAVTFVFKTNGGHADYTCVYRLRVHGEHTTVAH